MKICYLADAGSIHVQRWVEYFANNGHEVHLISKRSFGNCEIKNVNIHVLKKLPLQIRLVSFPLNILYNAIHVKKLIKMINPDILHAHFVSDYGIIGALSGYHPYVISAWGSDILIAPKKSKIVKHLISNGLKKADRIYAVSKNIAENITSNFAISANDMEVVPFGVDTELFQPSGEGKQTSNGRTIVFSNRNFHEVYNVESLINAIPLIIEKNKNIHFVIKGSGPLESSLKKLASDLNVDEYVTFVGWTEYRDMPKYLHNCDIYISIAISDGTPVSVLEAMACGKACIVTNVGGVSEWIEDCVSGCLIPPQQPQILAEKILKLVQDPARCEVLGKEAHRIVTERGDWYNIMEWVQDDYEKLEREHGIQ